MGANIQGERPTDMVGGGGGGRQTGRETDRHRQGERPTDGVGGWGNGEGQTDRNTDRQRRRERGGRLPFSRRSSAHPVFNGQATGFSLL